MKRLIRRLIYVVLIFIVAFLLAELLARYMFSNYADGDIYIEMAFDRLCNSGVTFDLNNDNLSKKFGFRLSPNSEQEFTSPEFRYFARTNSLGFRTKEIQSKGNNEYRVLLLGDSTFWGVGVNREDTVSTLVENFGRTNRGINLSVYNYSVSGYNTVQELIVAQTYVRELQPDSVILGVFIANDIIPNALAFIGRDGNYAVSFEKIQSMQSEITDRFSIFYHSIIFRIIALPVYVPKLRYQFAIKDDIIGKTYDLLKDFDRLMKEQGIQFAVVIIYPRDAVQGGLIEKWSQSRRVGNLLHLFCNENSITSLNLLDFMKGTKSKKKFFFQHDGHFNKEGNLLLAQAIFHHLIEPQFSSRSN